MKQAKQIKQPELKSARRLTPLELNALDCNPKHTVITPTLLDSITKSNKSADRNTAGTHR